MEIRSSAVVLPALIFTLLVLPPAFADEVYRWTDESGTVHYSTKPKSPDDKPADLPPINRENLTKRIELIKSKTPPNCRTHGGVDCDAGKDVDGSVICADGFKDSVVPFQFACLEARLITDALSLVDAEGQTTAFHASSKPSEQSGAQKLVVTIRNSAAIEAYGVEVSVPWRSSKTLQAMGPDRIDGYGVGEYTLAFDRDLPSLSVLRALKESNVLVTCTNCR